MKNIDYIKHENIRAKQHTQKRRVHRIPRVPAAVACLLLLAFLYGMHAAAQHTYKNMNQVSGSQISSQGKMATSMCDLSKDVTTDKLNIRSGPGTQYKVICTVPCNTKLMLTGKSNTDGTWIQVKTSDGKVGWCSSEYLGVSPLSSGGTPDAGQAKKSLQAGAGVNAEQVSLNNSTKPLHIDVSLSAQTVRVLDAKGRGVETFICSSGKKGDETPTGTFTVSQRGKSFFNDTIGEGAYYWVRFNNAYLFHSVPFDKSGEIEQNEVAKLGEPASHGCLRMSVENAKWIYDNIPDGTQVSIQ